MRQVAIALLLVGAAPAAAQTPTVAPAGSQQAAKPNPLDKVLCRAEDSLGSRLNVKRVCMTVREWKDQADANRERTEQFQQNGSGLCSEGCSRED